MNIPRLHFRKHDMRRLLLCLSFLLHVGMVCAAEPGESEEAPTQESRADLLILVGAGGEASYRAMFSEWAGILESVGQAAEARVTTLGLQAPNEAEASVKDQIHNAIAELNPDQEKPVWIALIGHGTFDGRLAKFNLLGPDVSSEEFAAWMEPIQRPVAVMNTTSASAPFLNALSGPNRVVLTATRDGFELNFARFGSYLVRALGNSTADFDKDGQTSLLEAFLMASRQVGEFYEIEGRLASEHALLDDTGDQKGIPADWFKGVRPVKLPEGNATPDGRTASQFHLIESELERRMSPEIKKQRDTLEQAIFELRDHRADLEEEAYFERLEALLIPLAELYETLDADLKHQP